MAEGGRDSKRSKEAWGASVDSVGAGKNSGLWEPRGNLGRGACPALHSKQIPVFMEPNQDASEHLKGRPGSPGFCATKRTPPRLRGPWTNFHQSRLRKVLASFLNLHLSHSRKMPRDRCASTQHVHVLGAQMSQASAPTTGGTPPAATLGPRDANPHSVSRSDV